MKILLKQLRVPTDFSNQSDVTLTHAVALAEQFDASLRLLHVVCAPSSPWNWGSILLEIVRYAEAHRIDVIAMGTHGRGGVKHQLLAAWPSMWYLARSSPSRVNATSDGVVRAPSWLTMTAG